ncbi:MAG: hypothetical protein FJ010_03850 [Chloroflexi bacterium]|nr:hypothetical protein [Chloroflexota bacterium]
MIGRKSIFFAVLAALIVTAVAFTSVMADDDTNTFKVVNHTHRDVRVEIYSDPAQVEYYGDPSHEADPNFQTYFIVPAGETAEILLDDDDVYYYAYLACGDDIIDADINMKEDITLTIQPCDRLPTTLEVRNHTDETISLRLIGSEEKSFTIESGREVISVLSGETMYDYDACDPVRDFSGVIDIEASGKTDLLMRSCEYFDSLVYQYGAGNVVNFRIINHATFPIILSLIGPMNDLMEIEPGVNRVTLVAGVYEYNYFMDYQLVSGDFFVTPNGNGVLLLGPSYTINYGYLEEDLE